MVDQLPALSSPEDLQHLPALIYSNDRNSQDWHYTDPDGKTGVLRVRPKMSANNGDVLRELAIAGHAWSICHNFYIIGAELWSVTAIICRLHMDKFGYFWVYPKPQFCPNGPVLLLISWRHYMGLTLLAYIEPAIDSGGGHDLPQ